MVVSAAIPNRPSSPRMRREPVVANSVLAMLIFVATEVMFFGGIISAYIIGKSGAVGGWPPAGQPRLPIEVTGFNSMGLVASGIFLWLSGRAFDRRTRTGGLEASSLRQTKWFLRFALGLGALFVLVQGSEWAQLIAQGMTLTFSTHAAFFYLIVGTHALHAIISLCVLIWVWRRITRADVGSGLSSSDSISKAAFTSSRIFWYFVVGVWPVLYAFVYL